MKQLKVIIISIMSMLMTMPYAKAQEETVTNEPHNIIKLNCGTGMLFSKIYDNSKRIEKNNSSTIDLAVDYVHINDKNHGYIISFINSMVNGLDKRDYYLGIGVYGIHPCSNGWYYDGNIGIGYITKDYSDNKNGIGLMGQLGGGYKLNKHLGIGANLRILTAMYMNSKAFDNNAGYYNEGSSHEGDYMARLSLSLSMQYFF